MSREWLNNFLVNIDEPKRTDGGKRDGKSRTRRWISRWHYEEKTFSLVMCELIRSDSFSSRIEAQTHCRNVFHDWQGAKIFLAFSRSFVSLRYLTAFDGHCSDVASDRDWRVCNWNDHHHWNRATSSTSFTYVDSWTTSTNGYGPSCSLDRNNRGQRIHEQKEVEMLLYLHQTSRSQFSRWENNGGGRVR